MAGPRRLVEWPWVVLDVECALCRRRGRYRLARLAERYGADMKLTALLDALAARCGLNKPEVKPRQYEARCGARFLVPTGGPLPADAPGREMPKGGDPPRLKRLGYDGPLPTIAETRRQGITMVRLCCLGLKDGVTCFHAAEIALDALGLPDEAAFIHIPRMRQFRCRRCGSRRVQVLPSWPDVRKQHAEGLGADTSPKMPGTVRDYRMPGLGEPEPKE